MEVSRQPHDPAPLLLEENSYVAIEYEVGWDSEWGLDVEGVQAHAF